MSVTLKPNIYYFFFSKILLTLIRHIYNILSILMFLIFLLAVYVILCFLYGIWIIKVRFSKILFMRITKPHFKKSLKVWGIENSCSTLFPIFENLEFNDKQKHSLLLDFICFMGKTQHLHIIHLILYYKKFFN